MKLTALIPVYNDAYALGFCLDSIIEHFDEIVVFDDASTDETPEVALDVVRRARHVRYVRHEGRQLGWIEARNRLAALTDSEHLFWLDSDDVLCWYGSRLLREIAEGDAPVVRLQLTEMWGDFFHTTQRLRHYDRCHVYVNRRLAGNIKWGGGTAAQPIFDRCATAGSPSRVVFAANGPGPLFFHIKGVKPDRRLVERAHIRGWLRQPDRTEHLEDAPAVRVDAGRTLSDLSDEEAHKIALWMLFKSRQDRLVPSYLRPQAPGLTPLAVPRRPEVIESALPGRFEIVYDSAGSPIERIDCQERWSSEDAVAAPQLAL